MANAVAGGKLSSPELWRAYAHQVYGEPTELDRSQPEVLLNLALLPSLQESRQDWPPVPCFRFTGAGDAPCTARGLGLTDGKFRNSGRMFPPLHVYNPHFVRRAPNWNHSDHEWVEVQRVASNCTSAHNVWIGDGLMPISQKAAPNGTRLINGCWFNIVRGTGVWVNVGRSWRWPSRNTLDKLVVSTFGRSVVRERVGTEVDVLWCSMARKLGYDSIQVCTEFDRAGGNQPYIRRQSKRNSSRYEAAGLVICGGGCAKQHVRTSCPPVPIRTGIRAQLPCRCNIRHALLNCGNLRPYECIMEGRALDWYRNVPRGKYRSFVDFDGSPPPSLPPRSPHHASTQEM